MIIGYARVSTADQSLDAQTDALAAAGVERMFADKITGTARKRPELDRMLDQLRPGDVVVVAKYDRLARSLHDLLDIVKAVQEAGAGFRSLAEDIDTTTPTVSYSTCSPPSPSSSGTGFPNEPKKDLRQLASAAGSGANLLPFPPLRKTRCGA